MIAGPALVPDPAPPPRRFAVTPLVEFLVLAVAVAVAVISWLVIARTDQPQRLLPPPLVALLLVVNIVPGVAVMILFGRRIARRRAARSPIGGDGQLHVRLVALFSVMATMPVLLVAISASLLFQYGGEFLSSPRARGMLVNATSIARDNYRQEFKRVADETRTMSGDLSAYLQSAPLDRRFSEYLFLQTLHRNLSEAMIVRRGEANPVAVLNPYDRPLKSYVTPAMMAAIDRGAPVLTARAPDRAGALVPLAYGPHTYLYAARIFDESLASQLRRGDQVLADYHSLQRRSRLLQIRFNLALLVVSLLIVGIAVWIALAVADRLVAPVAALVDAARRVEGGDLTARVPDPRARDEVGTLSRAFNSMTARLQQQNGALESRRALIEAVMSGVSAGVISVDQQHAVRTINQSALALLDVGERDPVGRPLREIAPELDQLLDGAGREAVVQVQAGGEPRTLAVRIARAEAGPILTFDDMTEQLHDQRRAAWADVARRIAHEIKNPLTPIQLAAERLQRRYGKLAPEGDTTFGRLTETIVRQVGDLRRMVDEFSSFARLPKPVFREEALVDIARQTMFLHEVAHPGIFFRLVHDEPGPALVCDRRQIGQAFTNIVKNAVEAIEEKGEGGSVTMRVAEEPGHVTVTVADTGVGLPAERDRIAEPYMTTRARGTGLGLAIVKKIIEEHAGTLAFLDNPGGGTCVTMTFDTRTLAALDRGAAAPQTLIPDGPIAALSRTR